MSKEEPLRPDIEQALRESDLGGAQKIEPVAESSQTLFTKETEDVKKWAAIEARMHEHYKGIIEQIMSGKRETLEPISQKVFDAYLSEEDENIRLVLAQMKEKGIPPERAEPLLRDTLEQSADNAR